MFHMTMRQAKHPIGTVACITAVVYLALVAVAAGCLFMHAAPTEGHDHHTHDSTHSSLCGWSCQAMSGTALISDPYTLTVWNGVSKAILHPVPLHSDVAAKLRQPRGPPRLLAS